MNNLLLLHEVRLNEDNDIVIEKLHGKKSSELRQFSNCVFDSNAVSKHVYVYLCVCIGI